MSELDKADQLLQAAHTGGGRCLAHGHTFDVREPVVVSKVDDKLELWCRQCAEYYDQEIHRAANSGKGDR